MNSDVRVNTPLILLNSLSTVIEKVLGLVMLVWLQQFLLRELGPEEYSLYPVIVAVILLARIIMTILTGGVARYVNEAYALGNSARITTIVSSIMPPMMAVAALILTLGGLATYSLDSIITVPTAMVGTAQLMFALMIFEMSLGLVTMPLTVGFQVREKFVLLSTIRLGDQLLRISLILALMFGVSTRIEWVVVGSVSSNAMFMLVIVVVSRRLLPALKFDRSKIDFSVMRTLMSFGGWQLLGTIAHRLRTSADTLILNRFGTFTDVACFHIGSLPDRRFSELLANATGVVLPALTSMHARNESLRLQRAYLRGNRYYLWLALMVAAPLIGFRVELVSLYVGDRYLATAAVLLLLHAAYPLTYACEMLYLIAVASAKVRLFMIGAFAVQVFNVVLTLYLVAVRDLGAYGAALGTMISTVVGTTLFFWPLGLRMLRVPFYRFARKTLIPGIFPGVLCLIFSETLASMVSLHSWMHITLAIMTSMLVYLLLVCVFLQREDRQEVRKVWGSLRARFDQLSGKEHA